MGLIEKECHILQAGILTKNSLYANILTNNIKKASIYLCVGDL